MENTTNLEIEVGCEMMSRSYCVVTVRECRCDVSAEKWKLIPVRVVKGNKIKTN